MDKQELDSRVQPWLNKAKIAGAVLVAVAASAAVVIGSLSIIAAAVTAVVALAAVNFVPVAARFFALKKQQSLTKLAETYSEETIREDERQEAERLSEQESAYKTQAGEFGNIIDELNSNMEHATEEEKRILQGQIEELQKVLQEAEEAIKQKAGDLAELRRVNKMYVSLHRAGMAMKHSQDQQRNAEQIQRVETARNAIKTRMREALAGKKIERLNTRIHEGGTPSISEVARISHAPFNPIEGVSSKEVSYVPNRR